MNSQLDYFTTTIANGETVSGAVDINGARVMLLHMPATLTGTKMHLQVSMDGVTYQQLYSAGALLEWTVAAGGGGGGAVTIFYRENDDKDIVNTTTSTSVFNTAPSITANTLGSTGGLRLTIYGDYLNNSASARTLAPKVIFGSTNVINPGAMATTIADNANRRYWKIVVELWNTATNAQLVNWWFVLSDFSASVGIINDLKNGQTMWMAEGYGTASEDTTATKTLDVQMAHSAAHASLSFRKKVAFVELLP